MYCDIFSSDSAGLVYFLCTAEHSLWNGPWGASMEALSSGGQAFTVLPLQHRAEWGGKASIISSEALQPGLCTVPKRHDWNSCTFAGAFSKLDLKEIKMFIERTAFTSDSDSELLLIRVPSRLLSG